MWSNIEQDGNVQRLPCEDFSLAPHGSFTPPRLHAVDKATMADRAEPAHITQSVNASAPDPGATQPLPNLAIAELRFSAEAVRRRAASYAEQARSRGVTHSMRLWKAGYEEAFLSLVREALTAPRDTYYELLSWRQEGEQYLVSVTFGEPPTPHAYH